MNHALILGIGGQDGSYLADILLGFGWEVHGLYRRSSVNNLWRLKFIRDRLTLHKGDLTDLTSVMEAIDAARPHVIFNEADQDDAGWSFKNAATSVDVTYGAVAKLLAWLHSSDYSGKFFQPLSATMFGRSSHPQNEETEFNPLSPYACAKAACYDICNYYRGVHGMDISTGIFFNHDSPVRGDGYLLQYLAKSAVDVALGINDAVLLGNPEAWVDVGHAHEYMLAAYAISQLNAPDDFVVATGRLHQVQALAVAALHEAGVEDAESHIAADLQFASRRPDTGTTLCGDSFKLRAATGWRAETDAMDLVRSLVRHRKEMNS